MSSSVQSGSKPITVVVGASRGIGAALVSELQTRGQSSVVATMRKPSSAFDDSVQVVSMDITDDASVKAAVKELPEIDTLIVNAAIGNDDVLLSTSTSELHTYLETNVIGVHRTILAFLPSLRARKTRQVIVVSSTSGSLEKQVTSTGGFKGPYAVTKAAANMLAVQYHCELKSEGFTVIPIHPGWVATDMGKIAGDGGIPPSRSAQGMLDVIKGLTPEKSGTFFQYDGVKLPW